MRRFLIAVKKGTFNLLGLTLPSLILIILLLEVFTRIFLPVSDIPDVIFDPVLGNHFLPNQEGVYIKGKNSEIQARYRINSSGWNSPYDYTSEVSSDVFRIAVIGDSFIEAFEVDYDESWPYLLERQLDKKKRSAQAYTFGHSGGNLMQYLAVLRKVAKEYNPNVVIINIVHNDFNESLYGYGRKDNWTLRYDKDKGFFVEIPPRPVSNLPLKKIMRKSALARYLIVNLDLFKTSALIRKIFYAETRDYEANIDIADLDIFSDGKFLHALLEYIFTEYRKAADEFNFKLLLVIDTDRQAIYSGGDPRDSKVYILNKASLDVAGRLNIPITDLTKHFKKDWRKNRQRFDWESDGHWNSYGHAVSADAVMSNEEIFLEK